METWVIVLLIVGAILVIAGISVGIYFLVRPKDTKKSHTPSGGGSGSGSGAGGGGSGSKLVSGNFSISPGSDSSKFLTFTPGSGSDPLYGVVSSNPKLKCSNYTWQNVADFNAPGRNRQPKLQSALIINTGSGIGDYMSPVNLTATFDQTGGGQLQMVNNTLPDISTILNWVYNPAAKSWCGMEDVYSGYCLYYSGSDVSVESFSNGGLTLSKSGFVWNNVSAITAPSCTS